MTTTLVLENVATKRRHVVAVRRLLIAGFTGRDTDALSRHLDELEREGIARPPSVPTLYELDPELATQTPVVVATGPRTSGEVEPVVVVADGQRLLTVGSDHTDRDQERSDIGEAKGACPKVIGTSCSPIDAIHPGAWDRAALRSEADGTEYQAGTLAELLALDDMLERLDLSLADGDVLFLGTVPTIGGLRPATSFAGTLRLPDQAAPLAVSYRIIDTSSSGRRRLQKPEIEFSPLDDYPWVPVPGIEGQAERILAADARAGTATRMLRFDPGCDTSPMGVLRHDFWEEVTILSGELHDLTLDQVFGAGTYACRPPGMPHGPWRSAPGCVTFEVRYPAL